MPDRSSARIPQYRLHKPTGLGVVRLNNRDIYLGKHGTEESRQRYQEVIAKWLANNRRLVGRRRQIDSSRASASTNYSSPTGTTTWGTYVKNGRPTGELDNIKDAMKQVTQLHGRMRAAHFGPAALKAVRQLMIEADLSRNVINARVGRIRRMFKRGVTVRRGRDIATG